MRLVPHACASPCTGEHHESLPDGTDPRPPSYWRKTTDMLIQKFHAAVYPGKTPAVAATRAKLVSRHGHWDGPQHPALRCNAPCTGSRCRSFQALSPNSISVPGRYCITETPSILRFGEKELTAGKPAIVGSRRALAGGDTEGSRKEPARNPAARPFPVFFGATSKYLIMLANVDRRLYRAISLDLHHCVYVQ